MPRTSGGTGGGGGGAGGLIVRKFAFTHSTANLDTGAALYTPTVGDILYDAWIEVDTAWDGITPNGDFGTFAGTTVGLLAFQNAPADMTQADALAYGLLETSQVNSLSAAVITGASPNPIPRWQLKFATTDQIKIVVSQSGNPTAQSIVLADSAPTLPLTIVLATNDTFIFTPTAGGGTPETFTIAPGVYTTIAEAVAAMAAATGTSADTFGQYVTPSVDSTKILLTNIVDSGIAGNGDTITEGDGGAAALGFTANPDTFASGNGGDPGSTQGAGILYLVTATPT